MAGRDIGLDRRHAPVAERDIAVSVQILRRIDHLTAFEKQIVCASAMATLPVPGPVKLS